MCCKVLGVQNHIDIEGVPNLTTTKSQSHLQLILNKTITQATQEGSLEKRLHIEVSTDAKEKNHFEIKTTDDNIK